MTNTTYLDCPIADFDLRNGSEVLFYVVNSNLNEANMVQVAVPNGHFMLSYFNTSSNGFEDVKAEVHCYNDTRPSGEGVENCQLFAAVTTAPESENLFRLTYHESHDITVPPVEAKQDDYIESDEFMLVLGAVDDEEGLINFSLIDKATKASHDFDFSLRYWYSWVQYWGPRSSSGAYTFRPIDNLYYPLAYT